MVCFIKEVLLFKDRFLLGVDFSLKIYIKGFNLNICFIWKNVFIVWLLWNLFWGIYIYKLSGVCLFCKRKCGSVMKYLVFIYGSLVY